MAMTWKRIEASRERRLWLTQVVIPTLCAFAVLYQVPEFRSAMNDAVASAGSACKRAKDKVVEFFDKR